MKSKVPAIILASSFLVTPLFGQTNTLSVGTDFINTWLMTSGNVTNAVPYVYSDLPNSFEITPFNVGYYVSSAWFLGETPDSYDGFWRADNRFFLPAGATNVVLTFSRFFVEDAGVLLLNATNVIASTETLAPNGGTTNAYMVFSDGAPRVPWTFQGQDGTLAGTITNGFVAGATNVLSIIVNNTTDYAASGILQVDGWATFRLAASVSYEVIAAQPSLTINLFPGVYLSGTVGGTYAIQYTTSLSSSNWLTLTNITLPNSPYLFVDTNAVPDSPKRFYRALAL